MLGLLAGAATHAASPVPAQDRARTYLMMRLVDALDLPDDKALALRAIFRKADERRIELVAKRQSIDKDLRAALSRPDKDQAQLAKLVEEASTSIAISLRADSFDATRTHRGAAAKLVCSGGSCRARCARPCAAGSASGAASRVTTRRGRNRTVERAAPGLAARSVRGFSFKLSDEVRAAFDAAQRRCRGPDAYHGLNWGKAVVTPNRTHAGAQRDAMSTVADTLRAGAHPIQWQEWARIGGRSGTFAGLGHLLGYPEVGRLAGAVPAVVTLAAKALPKAAAPLLLSPGPAGWLASLPQVGRVAAPWTSVGLRAAGQAGTAAVRPPPVATPGG